MEDFSKDERHVDARRDSSGNEENVAHIDDGHLTILKHQEKELFREVTLNGQLQAKMHYLWNVESE